MAVGFRNAQGSNNAGGGPSITMTMPTGVQDGDVLLMSIMSKGSITPPSGWTDLNLGAGTAYVIYWKVASSEPSSFIVTVVSGKTCGTIIAISGASSIIPSGGQLAALKLNSSTAVITSNATGSFASSNGMSVFFGDMDSQGTTAAAPTSYSLGAQSASTGGSATSRNTSGVSYKILSSVSSVSALSATYGASSTASFGQSIFIMELSIATIPNKIYQTKQAVNRSYTY